jgi:hypothetical protein
VEQAADGCARAEKFFGLSLASLKVGVPNLCTAPRAMTPLTAAALPPAPLEWAPRAAAAMAARAKTWVDETAGCAAEARAASGLRAAWLAWCDAPYGGVGPPLHSKCIGFALPTGEYYAVYLMDLAALERGEYAYGRDLLLGWPSIGGAMCAFLPSAVTESRSTGLAAPHVYEWRGEYNVEARPWFIHGCRGPEEGSWTAPYLDPVTGDRVVSFVEPGAGGAVVIAGAFAVD